MHKNPIVRQIRVIPTTDSITINNLSNILSFVVFWLKFFYCLTLKVFDRVKTDNNLTEPKLDQTFM